MKKSFILLALLGCLMAVAQESTITNFEREDYGNIKFKKMQAEYVDYKGATTEYVVFIANDTPPLSEELIEKLVDDAFYNHLRVLKSPRSFVIEKVLIYRAGTVKSPKWDVDIHGFAHNSYGAEVDSWSGFRFKMKNGVLTPYWR